MSSGKRFSRVKITDVSKAVGLSVSTVSRALNGYSDVSDETRQRIMRQAESMGYTASSIGARLRKGRGRAAGFVIPPFGSDFADPVFLAVLAGADQRLREAGMQILVTTAASEEDGFAAMRRMIESDQVDSMILVRLRTDDPRVLYLHERGVPFSLLGRSESVPAAASVEVDTGLAVRISVRRLAGLGRKRIVHINAPLIYNYGLDRARAFRDEIHACGLDPALQVETVGDLTEHGGYRRAAEMLQETVLPDAFICANDAMAIGALHAIFARGLKVGTDISLIGFDDIPAAALVNPPLTTHRVPFRDLGIRLADHLLQELEGTGGGRLSYIQEPTLVVRET